MFLYGWLYNYALFLKVSHNDLRMCIFQSSVFFFHLTVSLHPGICIYLSWVFLCYRILEQEGHNPHPLNIVKKKKNIYIYIQHCVSEDIYIQCY